MNKSETKDNPDINLFLVTGVSSGLGYQISHDLLEEGYRVLGISRSTSLKTLELEKKFPNSFYFRSLDLSKEIDDIPKWIINASQILGRFSGLVHAAGIQQTHPLQANTYSHMMEVFNLNLFSGLALAKGISDKRVMNKQGGSLVFISSIASKIGQAGLLNYSASKSALNGAMRSMASELAPRNIRVNSVLPGFVMTEMIEKWKNVYNSDYIDQINKTYPLGLGEPKDVANMVIYLLNNKSKWITGSEFDINGGGRLGVQ